MFLLLRSFCISKMEKIASNHLASNVEIEHAKLMSFMPHFAMNLECLFAFISFCKLTIEPIAYKCIKDSSIHF